MRLTFKIILVILMLFAAENSFSQVSQKANNILYLDLGIIFTGSTGALGIGLNYERMISDNVSIRAGINLGMFGAGKSGDAFGGYGIGFPVSFNYLTNNKNKFEVGAGGGPYLGLDNKKVRLLPAVRIGYRYQTDEEGMMYRAGVEFPSNLYISLAGVGYHFK